MINFIENDFKVDGPMLLDTLIDTTIFLGSYYTAVGLVTLAVALIPFNIPGFVVVLAVIGLSIGINYIVRKLINEYR